MLGGCLGRSLATRVAMVKSIPSAWFIRKFGFGFGFEFEISSWKQQNQNIKFEFYNTNPFRVCNIYKYQPFA